MKKTAAAESIRLLKSGTCPSLSGMSKLVYEIGCGPDSEIYIRISKNSGGGFYSQDWVAWDQLLKVLAKQAGMPIVSNSLAPLFEGKSVNTAGFLLAALKNEGLVQPMAEKRRSYECLDGKAFISEVQGLMKSPAAPVVKPKAKPRPAKR